MVQGGKQCAGRNSLYATPKTWESVWDFGSALLRASEQAIGTGEGLRRFERATLCTSRSLECAKRSKIGRNYPGRKLQDSDFFAANIRGSEKARVLLVSLLRLGLRSGRIAPRKQGTQRRARAA